MIEKNNLFHVTGVCETKDKKLLFGLLEPHFYEKDGKKGFVCGRACLEVSKSFSVEPFDIIPVISQYHNGKTYVKVDENFGI